MSLFSPTPVLSIVVPYSGQDDRFEDSLISVLENRPRRCEVLVCHDGSYNDPFELGDEVSFVVSEQQSLPAQILSAAGAAKGRVLHVLAEGNRGTEGWTDASMDCFDDETVASVAPSLIDGQQSGIASIGWTQSTRSVLQSVATGKRSASRRDQARVTGAYLAASFWRTDLVRRLESLPTENSALLASALWTAASSAAGFRCHSEPNSRIIAGDGFAAATRINGTSARHLQSIASVTGKQSALQAGLAGLLANAIRPGAWGQAVGRLSAAWADSQYQQRIRSHWNATISELRELRERPEAPATIKMPRREFGSSAPLRRAA